MSRSPIRLAVTACATAALVAGLVAAASAEPRPVDPPATGGPAASEPADTDTPAPGAGEEGAGAAGGDDVAGVTAFTRSEVARFLDEHPGATRIAPHQVAWEGGDVVLTFPSAPDAAAPADPDDASSDDVTASRFTGFDLALGVAPASAAACGAGWSCVYEHTGFSGRRLQFRSCGYTQSLGAYGFANSASSWVNNRGAWTRLFDNGATLITAYGYASLASLGSANDRADTIHLYC